MNARSSRFLCRLLPAAVLLTLAVPAAAAQAWWVQAEPAFQVQVDHGDGPRVVVSSLGRGFLGVSLIDITEELREFYGAPADAGVLVSRVEEDSPAAAAGFRVGDVITGVAGDAVERARDVVRGVSRFEPEETVEVEVVRSGAVETLSATLGERERGVWFSGDWEGPAFGGWRHLSEELPRIMVNSEEAQRAVREAMDKARERMRDIDFGEIAERLAEAEERLRELEAKLAERER